MTEREKRKVKRERTEKSFENFTNCYLHALSASSQWWRPRWFVWMIDCSFRILTSFVHQQRSDGVELRPKDVHHES